MTDSISTMTTEMSIKTLTEDVLSLKPEFKPGISRYVLHTSTIPLSTTMDELDYHQGLDDPGIWTHAVCSKPCCMYEGRHGRRDEHVRHSCACKELGIDLEPICWLTFIKKMSTKLNDSADAIDPREVMICFDSRSILDNTYPRHISGVTGISGFGRMKPEMITQILGKTYWFRKHRKRYKLDSLFRAIEGSYLYDGESKRRNLGKVLEKIKQTLFFTNNMIIKKMLVFGPETTGYKEYAEHTARMFRDLMYEYIARDFHDIPKECLESIFIDAKKFFDYCKQYHDHPKMSRRVSVLDYKFTNRSLGSFFGTELRRVGEFVNRQMSMGRGDLTTSIGWNWRFTALLQTRSLSYMPFYLARQKISDYWNQCSRDLEKPSREELEIIHKSVLKELDETVERGLLSKNTDFAMEIKDSITLDLKDTASYTSRVDEGGKLEDARRLLEMLRLQGWRAPIRDLGTFEIVDFCPGIDQISQFDDVSVLNLSSTIFWTALQMTINYLVKCKMWRKNDEYPFILKDGKEYIDDKIFCTKLLGINEPGSLRVLCKAHAYLNWMLIPGSKMSQKSLATNPDHTAGLELGAHDWHHEKRISGESPEARSLYDMDGRLREDIYMVFSDLVKATDALARRRGIQALKTFFGHIGFPMMYGALILTAVRAPLLCTETVMLSDIDEDEKIVRKGLLKEGFPMGNQMTKTILHLVHIASRGYMKLYGEKKGFRFMKPNQGRRIQKTVPFRAEKAKATKM